MAVAHELPELVWGYGAAEALLNEEPVRLDHDRHHARYVKGLNEAERQPSVSVD